MCDPRSVAGEVTALVQRLPVLDKGMERLLGSALSDGASGDALLDTVREDSGLCAQLLFLANSSCAAPRDRGRVETVDAAWQRVGLAPLQMLIASTTVSESVRRRFVDDALWAEYVAHSLAISRSCRILAELWGLSRDECEMNTVAGLTHDIGRVIIMIAADCQHAELLGTSPERMRKVVRDEEEAYGLNHCDVGELLFRKWGFSDVMKEGILRHHTPLVSDDFSRPGAIIFVSHFVTMSDFTGETIAKMLGPRLLERLDVSQDELNEAKRRYAEVKGVFAGETIGQMAGKKKTGAKRK